MINITVIGDSHPMFFAKDQRLLKRSIPEFDIGTSTVVVDNANVTYIWRNAKVARTLTPLILEQMFDETKANKKDIDFIVFIFGTVDVINFMDKYDNYKESVDLYLKACIEFSNKINATPLFILPIVKPNLDKVLNQWNEYLISQTKKLDLIPPINPFDIVARDYESEIFDKFNHLKYKDYDAIIDEVVKNINKILEG